MPKERDPKGHKRHGFKSRLLPQFNAGRWCKQSTLPPCGVGANPTRPASQFPIEVLGMFPGAYKEREKDVLAVSKRQPRF